MHNKLSNFRKEIKTMSSIMSHGLSALMEATKQTENAETENEKLTEAFESAIDDDIKDMLTGGAMDDEVENDIEGEGIGDEEEMEKLLASIPPSDANMEDDIEDITEGFFGNTENATILENMGVQL
jgi:uncharacterized protein with von Willebrand factor type A (vWA) domain